MIFLSLFEKSSFLIQGLKRLFGELVIGLKMDILGEFSKLFQLDEGFLTENFYEMKKKIYVYKKKK